MRATVTVKGELVDHLGPAHRSGPVTIPFDLTVGLRDLLQSIGIPHVEVGRVEVDGEPATWETRLDRDALVEAWPRYPMARPDSDPRFLLDVHLGKLARLLRLLGFDAVHHGDAGDADLAREAVSDGRILLSRDRGLLMRASLGRARWLRATDPEQQTIEVLDRFVLSGRAKPFSRCMACNTPLEAADPGEVDVPSGVRARHHVYRRCPGCGRVYWPGTHAERLQAAVERILGSPPAGSAGPAG